MVNPYSPPNPVEDEPSPLTFLESIKELTGNLIGLFVIFPIIIGLHVIDEIQYRIEEYFS